MWIVLRLFIVFALGNGLTIKSERLHIRSISVEQESLDLALIKSFPRVKSVLSCVIMTRVLQKWASTYKDDQGCMVYDETLIQETDIEPAAIIQLIYVHEPNYEYVPVEHETSCPNWRFRNSGLVLEYQLELNQCVLIEGLREANAFPSNAQITFHCTHKFTHPADTKIRVKINPDLFQLQSEDNCNNGNMTFKGFRNAYLTNDPEDQSDNVDDYTICSNVKASKVLEALNTPEIKFFKYGGNLDGSGVNFTACAVSIA